MATKNNPGAYDCYANALPDEPLFVLLGRDVVAAEAVDHWCHARVKAGKNTWTDHQIVEAMECARRMEEYEHPVAGNHFRKKPVVVEAITFDQLVEHGKTSGATLIHGMPWSFSYKGQAITHENDDCYLIPTLEGMMKFSRGDMLITGIKGEIYPCKSDIFAATYEPA